MISRVDLNSSKDFFKAYSAVAHFSLVELCSHEQAESIFHHNAFLFRFVLFSFSACLSHLWAVIA